MGTKLDMERTGTENSDHGVDSTRGHSAAQWAAVVSGLIGTALLYRLKPEVPEP